MSDTLKILAIELGRRANAHRELWLAFKTAEQEKYKGRGTKVEPNYKK